MGSSEESNAILIPDAEALPESFFEVDGDIGITSGASAPEHLVDSLIRKLQSAGWQLAD